jgi:hypothetical protein
MGFELSNEVKEVMRKQEGGIDHKSKYLRTVD